MTFPQLSPSEITFVVLMEIDKRLSAGADFVLCRLPGRGHLLVLRSGENGRDEQQIITLLTKHMSERVAHETLDAHKSMSQQVDPLALIVTGYEFTPLNNPSMS